MPEPFVFPDAVALICDYLRDTLPVYGHTPAVGSRIPNPRPTNLVQVHRVGGPRLNIVSDDIMLSVDCWAGRAETAHDLAQTCRALIFALEGEQLGDTVVYRIAEVAGPYDLPDPLSDQPRYTFTTLVAMRGAVLAGS
jgi:hypothetical protein